MFRPLFGGGIDTSIFSDHLLLCHEANMEALNLSSIIGFIMVSQGRSLIHSAALCWRS
jgi:hypothetical protein